MKNTKRLVINMASQIISFLISVAIGFTLTPYIISTIGEEANGFIGLAESFISYATIFTTALNSMASRFVAIAINRDDTKSTNEYMSSLIIANIVISIPLTIVASIVISLMGKEGFISVDSTILGDVKLLWVLLFANFVLGLIGNVFSVATYSKNRLDLSSGRQIVAHILKCVILLICFSLFKPSVWYVGLATLIMRFVCDYHEFYFYKKTASRCEN